MNFNDKLDFLMNLTKTSNSSLAHFTSIDSSYISRLRRGKRDIPKNANYISSMALYFTKNLTEDYQKNSLINVMKLEAELPDDNKKVEELITLWLLEDNSENDVVLDNFLNELSNFQFSKSSNLYTANQINISKYKKDISIYYGIEGRRESVIEFLSTILSNNNPHTLLLYSEEEMDWLSQNNEFKLKWASLMSQIILKGNKIKIIHTVSRNLDEMLSAINEWMPLYMTGLIEPYYYPKKRDGIFKRTLFIAPETCAVISTSVGDMTDSAANFLLRDKKAVNSITQEYLNYLAFCKPLMKIFTTREKESLYKTLLEFEKQDSETIIKSETLSLLTMPCTVITRIMERMEIDNKSELIEYLFKRKENFENCLQENSYIEIITLPSVEMVVNNKVPIAFVNFFCKKDCYYLIEEFILHLENIVSLLQNCENYHVFISEKASDYNCMIYVKEDVGVIVAKITAPSIFMAINESNMTASFWDFINNKIDKSLSLKVNKELVIKRLLEIIDILKSYKM